MLLLFDIDGTMIRTTGAGIRAMLRAGRELFGPHFNADGVEFGGRLDPLIIHEMLAASGIDPRPEHARAIRAAYRRHLPACLDEAPVKTALPGVLDLLAALRASDAATLGLLTGNFAETGAIKLRACGIDPDWFAVQVWGDESPHDPPRRDHLPPLGLARYRDRRGRDPAHTVVIGDTPHDVACALAHGCRALGVGTGQFTPESLLAAGADRAVPDLADTADILAWLAHPVKHTSTPTRSAAT
jgi:phosphoglycolate phosphatase-like HAD superfamily hydrolase